MEDCIFCKIVKGEIPCAKVLETENLLAFLDIAPINKGHTLLIPKEHYPNLLELPANLGQELIEAMQKISNSLISVLKAEGINLGMNNFAPAGQVVFHAHFHLIPRYQGDGLKLWPQSKYDSNQEMAEIAAKLASKI